MIKYLPHKEIDISRWNSALENSANNIIYANSWYLDIVSPGWDALIMDDYKAVMPLTWKSKLGLKYIFKPFFIQQLGVFGEDISSDIVEQFLFSLPSHFRLADIVLNEMNTLDDQKFKTKAFNNFKLNIGDPYETIQKKYNRNCNRNIKKARSSGYSFTKKIKPDDLFSLLTNKVRDKTYNLDQHTKILFDQLINEALKNKSGEIVGLLDSSGNLVAAGLYLFSSDRLIFLLCGSTESGKENQAMYMLIDEQINRNAGKYLWYDFSGSNIPGIAYFNSTFGAKPYLYYLVSINKLSLPMKIITRKF
jgi:hypothetical protein